MFSTFANLVRTVLRYVSCQLTNLMGIIVMDNVFTSTEPEEAPVEIEVEVPEVPEPADTTTETEMAPPPTEAPAAHIRRLLAEAEAVALAADMPRVLVKTIRALGSQVRD